MKSIKISMEISSPILVPKYPIHLDALLYSSLQLNTNWSENEILDELKKILAIENGVFKASAMRFTRTKQQPITFKKCSLATRTHWTEWPYSSHERAKTITTKGGGFRRRVTSYNGIVTPCVEFHAVGVPDRIHYLLDVLGFIGLCNNQGFGEITNIQIEEDQDFSFFDEQGSLARCLPTYMLTKDQLANHFITTNSIAPPYKTSERVESVIPDFRLKTLWN